MTLDREQREGMARARAQERQDARVREDALSMLTPEQERAIDALLWRRLASDRAYLHAENADAQAEREAELAAQCEREVIARG
jgi:hypothetical protein